MSGSTAEAKTRVGSGVFRNIYQMSLRDIGPPGAMSTAEGADLERLAAEHVVALQEIRRRNDEFLAMLSHELRNPLAPIVAAVEVLRLKSQANPFQQQACATIERQVERLRQLLDDLQEGAQIAAGMTRLRRERVSVGKVVQLGVETVRPVIDKLKHELEVSPPPQPIWLYADPDRLQQVVINLLHNAAKYTDEAGRISLTVRQEGSECVLRVADTGVGMAPELLPHIFELYTQGESTLHRAQGGLGIGLCVVDRLVKLHGGTVEAHSVLGQGSNFIVRLPLAAP